MIQVFKPYYNQEEIDAVAEVINSKWVGLGPKTAEFEKKFGEYSQVNHCIGLNSCTAALEMAIRLLNIGQGDEVIVPTLTFVSSGHSVIANQAKPVFVDVDKHTLNLDFNDVAKKITKNTKAIIAVHYGGRPVDMDKLKEIAGSIPIIEDCAHGSGSKYKGKPVGGLGKFGCFSFQAVKNLAMGEGGAITTNDDQMAERAKKLRWLGIDKGTWERTANDKSYWWDYEVNEIGQKSHLNDIHAAIGLVQLRKLDQANKLRKKIVDQYRESFIDIKEITMPLDDDMDYKSSWHYCEIQANHRNELSKYLRDNGVNTGVHYKPNHLYKCYGKQPSLPVAEYIFERILTLPLYPDLSKENTKMIINLIKKFYN